MFEHWAPQNLLLRDQANCSIVLSDPPGGHPPQMDTNERNAVCDAQGKRGVTGSTLADNPFFNNRDRLVPTSIPRVEER